MGAATYGWSFYAGLLMLLPLAGGIVASLCRRRGEAPVVASLTMAACIVITALLAGLFLQLPPGERLNKTWMLLPWLRPVAPSLAQPGGVGFLVDELSLLMLIVVVVVGAAAILFSIDYFYPPKPEHSEEVGEGRYYWWMLLFVLAMIGIALSPNFLQLFIFWEL
ncbi:MAG: hypothetical protein H5T86_14445, partial [Armatimonadetes bacterium]|nr:hypothetical protein [Armatimonadota bacterium]